MGFGTNLTEEYLEPGFDLNEILVKSPSSTFFVRVGSEDLQKMGIRKNDILLVDRALTPSNGDLVLAVLDGDFILGRYKRLKNTIYIYKQILHTKELKPIEVSTDRDFFVWGVAVYSFHNLREQSAR